MGKRCKDFPFVRTWCFRWSTAAAVLWASSGNLAPAQTPVGLAPHSQASTAVLRPVPKFGETSTAPATAVPQRPAGWNLRWRKSDQTESTAKPANVAKAPIATSTIAATAPANSANAPANAQPVRMLHQSGLVQRAFQRTELQDLESAPAVQQTNFQTEGGDDPSLQLPPSLQPPVDGDENMDIFNNAFEDAPATNPTEPQDAPVPPAMPLDPSAPAVPGLSMPQLEPTEPAEPAPQSPLENPMREPMSPNDRGLLPPVQEAVEPKLEPADEPELFNNPFTPMPRDSDRLPEPQAGARAPGGQLPLAPGSVAEFDCDLFRDTLQARTIDKISLDISPPFRPDVLEQDKLEQERRKFAAKQPIREWRSMDGYVMARGRLRDLAYEQVLIEAEHGGIEEIPVNRISEGDLAYLTDSWGLPTECRIRQEVYRPRNWTPSQVAWKASGLCHKPLYFEEVNLERYGHTAGPVLQPVLSSAHFFVNIAVLPYKMGIHPPTECQYTLGYYRPGSCAPWIVPPVPISLRGALVQAAVMSGVGALVP